MRQAKRGRERRGLLQPAAARRPGLRLACLLLGVAGCRGDPQPPKVQAARTLEAPPELEAEAAALSVVHAAPRGRAGTGSQVVVLFSKPMRALEPVAPAEVSNAPALPAPDFVRLQPPVPGSFRWLGARGVVFAPEKGHLPAASAYRVTVAAGARSLDGDRLAEEYRFEFETPRPRVLQVEPTDQQAQVAPGTPLVVHFNQPVAPAEVRAKARLSEAGAQKPLAFGVGAHPSLANGVVVTPRSPWPLDATVEFSLLAGLRGSQGSLPSEEALTTSFSTYGPLRITTLGCTTQGGEGCNPNGTLWVQTSTPVRPSELDRYLIVRPALARRPADAAASARNYHYLELLERPEPGEVYQLGVRRGLTDVYGQRLRRRRSRPLAMGDRRPLVRWPLRGDVFLPPLGQLPIESRNVEHFDAYASALDANQWLQVRSTRRSAQSRRGLVKQLNAARHAVVGIVDNDLDRHALPLPKGLATRGPVWVAYKRPDQDWLSDQVIQVTDLGVSAKISTGGSLVWVTRLSDGSPVPGAQVRLVGNSPAIDLSEHTDSDGLARFGADRFGPKLKEWGDNPDTLIWVDKGSDVSAKPIDSFLRRWRLQVPLHLAHGAPEYGMLTADRDLYRPGESVRIKGVVRRQIRGGNAVLDGHSLSVRLNDSQGIAVASQTVVTNEFGTFATDLRIPASATLGRFQIATEGLQGTEATTSLRVAEYRPASFEVSAETERRAYFLGEPVSVRVRGNYLFGAPLAGGTLSYSVTRQTATYSVPGSEGLATSDAEYRRGIAPQLDASERLQIGRATLDATGDAEFDLTPDWEPQTAPQRLHVEATVQDLSKQSITAQTEALVHPARYYLGIAKLAQRFVSAPSILKPKLVALSPDGARVRGRKVTLELVRRSWTVVRRANQDGSLRTESRAVDQIVDRCGLTTELEPRSCALGLEQPGLHFVVARSRDTGGNPAQAATQLYAIGPGEAGFADNDERKLDLVLDRDAYSVGETARLLIKSPFRHAEALLTLERDGLLESRRVTLTGSASTVEIPVDARMRPNVFVGVHLIQPVDLTPGGSGAPRDPGYRIGYAQLRVDAEAQRLALTVASDRPSYQPGQTLKLRLSARSADGSPARAELLVYAVDEAVLSLSGYAPQDPLGVFTAPRPLSVATLETRESLGYFAPLGIEGGKGNAGGGGGALGAARSRFVTTPLFEPNIRTDATGHAEVVTKLPDSLTRFRVMVMGVTKDDQYGTTQLGVEVRQPVMVRPALPRSLRAGDRFEAAVVVHAPGAEAGPMRVRASASGLRLEGPEEVTLDWDPSQPSRRVRFSMLAERAGEAQIDFSADGVAGNDAVSSKRTVTPPVALETTTLFGQTDTAEAQNLGDLSGLRPDTGGLEVMLSSTALVGLDAPLLQLRDYDYACTEQLASALLAIGPLSGLAARYGLREPEDQKERLERKVARILERQDGGGGFRLWPSSREPNAWVSAYTLGVLAATQTSSGAYIPQRVFDRGVHYLRKRLASEGKSPAALAEQAIAIDTLAQLGQPDPQFLLRLVEQREALPTFARALLLRAAARGSDSELERMLRQELEALVELNGGRAHMLQQPNDAQHWQLFDSPTRTDALALLALLESDPESEVAPNLARGLLARRRRGVWTNTQASAYSLLALDTYRGAREARPPAFSARLWVNRAQGVEASFGPNAERVRLYRDMAALAGAGAQLIFEKSGSGTLFYEARLRYARLRLPEQPLERGLFVSKAMRPVTLENLPEALETVAEQGVQRFDVGALVLVDLLLTSPGERHFVVLDDPLPSGLEAVDASLAVSGSSFDVQEPVDGTASGTRFNRSWHRKELRDSRVLFFVDRLTPGLYHFRYLARATTPGRFVMPPTRAEEMYSPETFGRSAAHWVVVE